MGVRKLPMNQTARIISIYAADVSGFCSALFEYGGMTVIHDASGCNSTYTTHDEPRWYDMDSMMYISGLTESDAVMGNDEKFVSDLCLAADELKPRFIAICASALPAMVGIDMEAIAYGTVASFFQRIRRLPRSTRTPERHSVLTRVSSCLGKSPGSSINSPYA